MSDEARTLKEALYNTIHRHPRLSVEAIAEQLDMAPSYLYRAATPDPDTDGPNASGVRFPLKQLIPLVRATDDFQSLDFIERSLGRVAIPVERLQKTSVASLCRDAIHASAEFGDLMRELEASCEDGKLSTSERQRIAKEGWEAIRSIMAIVAACEQNGKR